MLARSLKVINNVILRLVTSLRRFPEPLTLAFAIVVILIFTNHTKPSEDVFFRVAMTLALGIPLTLSIRMFFERSAVQKVTASIVYILVSAILIFYYNFLLPNMEMVAMTRYIAFTVSLYLLFMVIPYLGRKDGFELYVIKLFIGFIVTYFYSLVLFLGLAAILFTINTLFSAGIPSEVYFDLWLIVAGIFAPAYFLAGVPAYGVVYENKNGDYPKFLQVLLLYIVMPLLAVYTAILYVYFVKIIVTRFWPAGIVSNLVLWYSLLSTAVIFFIYLLKESNSWARTFITYFPKLILPLLLMMFVAMGIRINAYGITENRYLVMAGGLWTTGSMLYFAFKKNTMNIKIVLSAAIIAVLVVSGPWSAYNVSKHSQNAQMEKVLIKNNMLEDGKIVPSYEISQADKISISSIVRYFNQYHSLTELKVVPQDFSLSEMETTFGFDLTNSQQTTQYFSHRPEKVQVLLEVRDYDYFFSSDMGLQDDTLINKESLSIAYDSQIIKIAREGQVIYEKDIAQVALGIHEANIGERVLDNKEMIFADKNEDLKIMVIFHNINGTEDRENGQPSIEWLDFSLLFKVY